MSEPRRHFTREFRREAVQIVEQQGLSVAEAVRLRMEREILKKATAFFAKESR